MNRLTVSDNSVCRMCLTPTAIRVDLATAFDDQTINTILRNSKPMHSICNRQTCKDDYCKTNITIACWACDKVYKYIKNRPLISCYHCQTKYYDCSKHKEKYFSVFQYVCKNCEALRY